MCEARLSSDTGRVRGICGTKFAIVTWDITLSNSTSLTSEVDAWFSK